LKEFKVKLHEAPSDKFENINIHDARQDHSEYLLRELDDEIHKHIPEYKLFLELLKEMGVWQFDLDAFNAVCVSAKFAARLKEASPEAVLKDLFEFSVIGFYKAGGRGFGGSEYVFRYREPGAAFDATAVRFRVHPGLIETLGLKRVTVGEDQLEQE
jgi:hypothetical protein